MSEKLSSHIDQVKDAKENSEAEKNLKLMKKAVEKIIKEDNTLPLKPEKKDEFVILIAKSILMGVAKKEAENNLQDILNKDYFNAPKIFNILDYDPMFNTAIRMKNWIIMDTTLLSLDAIKDYFEIDYSNWKENAGQQEIIIREKLAKIMNDSFSEYYRSITISEK